MKSTKNTRAVTVGIFIFIGLAIFVVGILTLGGQHKTFANLLSLRASFDDVNGLQTGNNIWFSGVKVGVVKKIAFDESGKVMVDMSLDEQAQKYVHRDALAKIGTDGLIGNKIIVIYGGTPQTPSVKDGDTLRVEKIQGMDEMMNTLQSNNKNLLDITNDFKTVSSRLANGEGSIGKLLKDETLANQLTAVMNGLKTTSDNANRLTNNLANYTARLQAKGSLTNDLVTDTVVFSRLRSSMAQLEQVSRSANDMMNNLKATTQQINSNLNSNTSPAGVLLHDEEAAASLKATLQNLQTSTQKLDENMEAMQHNFLFRGYFKKQAKEKEKQEKEASKTKGASSNQ